MIVLQYILLVILLLSALIITLAVMFSKSSDDGLSGSIVGTGSDSYFGKDKGGFSGKLLFRITMIASIVFAVAVLAVYVIQPDYNFYSSSISSQSTEYSSDWQDAVQNFYGAFN